MIQWMHLFQRRLEKDATDKDKKEDKSGRVSYDNDYV